MSDTRYDEGDVVATPDGRGVVAAVLTGDFEFPQGDDEIRVTASEDSPGYVVGLESVGSAVYRASALEASSFDDGTGPTEGESETQIVDADVDGLDRLPAGWDRESVLEYWSSIGGSWEACAEDTSDELDEERARAHCSAMKDEVLGTERWRNRF
ncbi:hypothetical protein [Halovivax sp.]|uniref:hypothetical protein n=1 Tax=Halovivax sp. TaxID=1935978 RepID=UPI0025BD788B|nr:hypothetical protein [Halovivax sp.]